MELNLPLVFFAILIFLILYAMFFTGENAETVEKNAIAFYADETGDSNVTAKAYFYGCHSEVRIFKGKQIMKVYTYYGGKFY